MKKLHVEGTVNTDIYSKVNYKGYDYSREDYVAVFTDDIMFYKILEIVVLRNTKILIFGQILQSVSYNHHYLAYETNSDALGSFTIIDIDDVIGPSLQLMKSSKGKAMLRLKEYFKVLS